MRKVDALCTVISALLISPALSFGEGQPESGVSCEITAAIIFIDSANNLNPSGSKNTLTSLESAHDRRLTTIPALLPEATWRFGEGGRSSWYLNNKAPIDEAGDFAIATGLSHRMPGLATFNGGVFYVPFTEVWKNPYLLYVARQETDVTTWGAQLTAGDILNTQLQVQMAYLSEDVDSDDLAKLFPELGRDGEIYSLSVNYHFFRENPFSIRPQLSLRKGQYDGESSSFIKMKATLGGQYFSGKTFLMPSIHYSFKEYDREDPIFASTRRENEYGFNLIIKYMGLFDIKELSLMGIAGYNRGEANEDFYNSEALVCGLGLSYRF